MYDSIRPEIPFGIIPNDGESSHTVEVEITEREIIEEEVDGVVGA